MKRVHFVLQGKGGVGKSLISSLMTQYAIDVNGLAATMAIDTDPVNKTLAQFAPLKAVEFELMNEGSLDIRRFDNMLESVIESKATDIIIDNGASSFIPLSEYIAQTDAITALKEEMPGSEIFIHTVVTGGQHMTETAEGARALTAGFSDEAAIVIWLNEHFGEISFSTGGKTVPWENSKVYKEIAPELSAQICLQAQHSALHGKDIEMMLKEHLTFDEIEKNKDIPLFTRRRIRDFKAMVYEQLDSIITPKSQRKTDG